MKLISKVFTSLAMTAMAAGAARTVIVDVATKRLEKARELGATLIINGKDENIVQQIKAFTGGLGADVYFDAAGVQSTFKTGIASLKNGGRAVMVALFEKPVMLDATNLVMREITVKGTACYRHIFPELPHSLKLSHSYLAEDQNLPRPEQTDN